MRQPRATVVVLLAAALSLTGLAPAALAARSDAKAIWGPVAVQGKSEFPVYRELGVGIYEMSLNWAAVAPTRPNHASDPSDAAYRWPAEVDYAIREAARYHIRILLKLSQTPPWANGGRAQDYAPNRVRDLADFVTAAARRYPTVHLWMIWGEPNRVGNFAPLSPAPPNARRLTRLQAEAPHRYAQLLDASYGVLKRASRRNLVIGGNTFTFATHDISTSLWIQNLRLPNGRAPRMDLYGHNPFCYRHPDLANPPSSSGQVDFSDVARLSRLVDANLAPPHHRIRLFLSEWTIPTSPRDDEFNFWVTRAVQAQWIRDAWRIVRSSPFIYALGWIHLYDDPPGLGSTGGLLDYKGHPKPGYWAFRAG